MNAAALGILEDFIANEDDALAQRKQGDFYPPNRQVVKPLVATASGLLEDGARQRLYFHVLRMGELPPVKSQHDFALAWAAYAQVAPLLSEGFPSCSLQRAVGLLVFGFDDHGALPDEPPCTLDSYRHHSQLWAQCNAHSAIPYMLAHAGEFALYARDRDLVARILKLLRHTKYVHTDVSRQQEARYPVTRLWFWALVFVALLDTETAPSVVADFLDPPVRLPRYADQLQILGRFIDAVARPDLKGRMCAGTATLVAAPGPAL